MNPIRFKSASSYLSIGDRKRRKREIIIIGVIIVLVSLMTYAQNQLIHFGSNLPISDTILMFTMTNINMLLLLLLIFLVFRNLVKLLYDRKRKIMGSKLRTRLVITFVLLTLIPEGVLFFFSIAFITSSIDFWFNVPVEQALENSLHIGRQIYGITENSNTFYLEKIARHMTLRNLLDPSKHKDLAQYLESTQHLFNLDGIELYDSHAIRRMQYLNRDLIRKNLRPLPSGLFFREFSPRSVSSLSQMLANTEVIRTICTVPFDVKTPRAKAFLVITVIIPQYLTENMASISKGFDEYQQIKMLKKPIQTSYFITISVVALLVVFCAVWFGFYLAKSISIPIQELAEGTRRVAEGDLSFQIVQVGDDEIGSLVNSFNRMTHELRLNRGQLEQSSQKLRWQNMEIEEKRRYMEIVLKNISTGVITLDADGVVTTINTSAGKMLGSVSDEVVGRNYAEILRTPYLQTANDLVHEFKSDRKESVNMPIRITIKSMPRSFILHITSLKNDAGRHIGIVVVFDDLTELEKAQRITAWREVARRIAHEVKNPLTPISLSAQRLKRRYSHMIKEPVFDECTQMIIDHVEIIRNLVNEFSVFARFPSANLVPAELLPIIEETISLFREGYPDVHFELRKESPIPILKLDRQQIRQCMINLVDNAIASIHAQGNIAISIFRQNSGKNVQIDVVDDGAGISSENKQRLFEPDFTTKPTGMGLGLAIVNSIVTDHHGAIRVEDNRPKGARFIIELPI